MDFKALEKKNGKAFIDQLKKELKEFDEAIENGEYVPSGGYCKCHERYDCPCYKYRMTPDREYWNSIHKNKN